MRRNYNILYSHRGIVGERTVNAVDSWQASRVACQYLDARFGKGNWTFHDSKYSGKGKSTPVRGKKTIQRHWDTPPNPNKVCTSYAAMEKYGAWSYKV